MKASHRLKRITSTLVMVVAVVSVERAVAQTAVEPLRFHHVHLNSVDPVKAAEYYPKPFSLSATKTAFNGYEAVKTGNVYLLFTKVAATPQNELTGPQTAIWRLKLPPSPYKCLATTTVIESPQSGWRAARRTSRGGTIGRWWSAGSLGLGC